MKGAPTPRRIGKPALRRMVPRASSKGQLSVPAPTSPLPPLASADPPAAQCHGLAGGVTAPSRYAYPDEPATAASGGTQAIAGPHRRASLGGQSGAPSQSAV